MSIICPHCIQTVAHVAIPAFGAMGLGVMGYSIKSSWHDITRALRGERINSALARYDTDGLDAPLALSSGWSRSDLSNAVANERSTIAE